MRSEDFTRDFSDEDEFELDDDSSPSRHRHSTVFIGGVDGEALVVVSGDDGLLLVLRK
jgi:hypothetical protein